MKIGNLPKKIFLPLIYLPMKIFPRNFAHLFTYQQLFEFHQIINTSLHIIKKHTSIQDVSASFAQEQQLLITPTFNSDNSFNIYSC